MTYRRNNYWHRVVYQKYRLCATIKVIQTFFPIMKKVPQTQKKLNLSIILDKLTDLGWEYTCGCMTRSGMQTYDELMQYIGVIKPTEHWNEDCYRDKGGDW